MEAAGAAPRGPGDRAGVPGREGWSPRSPGRHGDPALEAPLRALRRRVWMLFLLEGGAKVLAALALLVGAAFGLDVWLHLPAAVRLLHLAAIGAGTLAAAWRWIVFPLRRPLDLDDMALQIEATHPELHDRLVSAWQLSRLARAEGGRGDSSPALVEALVAEARGLLHDLHPARALHVRPALRRGAAGCGIAIGIAMLLAASPENLSVWYHRALGEDVAWPQRTVLRVLLPTRNPNLLVRPDPVGPRVSLARGTDLLVRVAAQGVTPSRVTLHVATEAGERRDREMSRRGEDEFLYRFRAVVEAFTFHVTGGDDVDRLPTVRVDVLAPPEIEGLEAHYRYPAYTGLPPVTRAAPNLEGPAGTEVELRVRTNLPVASAFLRLGDDPRGTPLEITEDRELRAPLTIETPQTYSIALVAANGLRNLDPGFYTIRPIPDRPPSLKVLSPLPVDGEWTAQASLPIRVRATDDYGVVGMNLRAWTAGAEEEAASLWHREVPLPGTRAMDGAVLLELRDAAAALAPPGEGPSQAAIPEGFVIRWAVEARDGRPGASPDARGQGPEGRIEVIGVPEFHRKWMERQIRMKDDLILLRKQQATLRERTLALSRAPESGAVLEAELRQGQIVRKLRAGLEGLVRLFEAHLFNRTETSSQAEALLQDAFALAVERQEAGEEEDALAYALAIGEMVESGRYGSLDILGRILAMIRVGSAAHTTHGPAALAELRAARVDVGDAPRALERAAEAQARFLAALDDLLSRMEEWEDYQEILRLARELMESQRDLEDRTRAELPHGASPPPGE